MIIDENGVVTQIGKEDVDKETGTLIIPHGVKTIDWGKSHYGEHKPRFEESYYYECPDAWEREMGEYDASRGLKRVVLPDTLEEIGESCFCEFSDLETVIMPDSVTTIGCNCFYGCKNLQNVRLSNNITEIPSNSFGNVTITSLIIPDSVTDISLYAFYESNFGVLKLPRTYNKPEHDFDNTQHLVNNCSIGVLVLPESEENAESISNYPKIKRVIDSAHNSELSLTRSDVEKKNLDSHAVEIDSSYDRIDELAFSGLEDLEYVIIDEGVTHIGAGAFANCPNLKSVQFPKSLKTIDDYAFAECPNLLAATLPKNVKKVGNSSFSNCYSLLSISLPNGLEQIGDYAFANSCRKPLELLSPSDFPSQMPPPTIPINTIISIPSSTRSIGKYAFSGCKNVIYANMAENCKVSQIPEGAFAGCENMCSFEISNGVEIIEAQAFKDCKNLNGINCLGQIGLPKSLKEIKSQSFGNCESLRLLLTNGTVQIANDSFANNPNMKVANLENLNINIKTIGGTQYDVISPEGSKGFSLAAIKKALNINKRNIAK